MSREVIKLEKMKDNTVRAVFECPGCEMPHYPVVKRQDAGALWSFNNDFEHPTLSPSVLVAWEEGEDNQKKRCHSFVRGGKIQFLSDCTHELAGKTVNLETLK